MSAPGSPAFSNLIGLKALRQGVFKAFSRPADQGVMSTGEGGRSAKKVREHRPFGARRSPYISRRRMRVGGLPPPAFRSEYLDCDQMACAQERSMATPDRPTARLNGRESLPGPR